MRKPWGVSKIYSITDPAYRGLLFIPPERLYEVPPGDGQRPAKSGPFGRRRGRPYHGRCLRFIDREFSVRPHRPCICHSNFMSPPIEKMQKLSRRRSPAGGIYLDGATLMANFGSDAWPTSPLSHIGRAWRDGGRRPPHAKIGAAARSTPTIRSSASDHHPPAPLDRSAAAPRAVLRRQAIELYHQQRVPDLRREGEGLVGSRQMADFIVLDKDPLTCP